MNTIKNHYEVGLLLRGEFRLMLEKMTWQIPDSKYKEIKGWCSSTFFVDAPPITINQLNNICSRVNKL